MEKTDLLKLLRPGEIIFSVITGKPARIVSIEPEDDLPITIGSVTGKSTQRRYNRYGSIFRDGSDCLLLPSEDEADWTNYSPFKKGDIVVAYNEPERQKIGVFSHREGGKFYIFEHIDREGIAHSAYNNCEYPSCEELNF